MEISSLFYQIVNPFKHRQFNKFNIILKDYIDYLLISVQKLTDWTN